MSFLLQPWHILLAALCGLVKQRQQQVIEFQNAQIETLLKQLEKGATATGLIAFCDCPKGAPPISVTWIRESFNSPVGL